MTIPILGPARETPNELITLPLVGGLVWLDLSGRLALA